MSKQRISTVCELVGGVLIVAGVALLSFAAGLIVGGVIAGLYSWKLERGG
jgi:hypothetical protein